MSGLTVAVLVPSARPPAWIAGVIERLARSDGLHVDVFVDGEERREKGPLAYRAYERLDGLVFGHGRDALAATDLNGVRPRAAAEIGVCDVILQLASTETVELVSSSRHGVWVLRHHDSGGRRSDPPLFREVESGEVYCTTLEAHLRGGERRILYRSCGRPDRTSLRRTRSQAYWKASGAIVRAVAALGAGGPWYLDSRPTSTGEAAPERQPPSAAVVARHVAAVALGVLGRRVRQLVLRKVWLVATRSRIGPSGFVTLDPSTSEQFADPFLFEHGGHTHLFFERYDEHARKASIAHVLLADSSGATTTPTSVLAPAYHVSYPFVFGFGREIFMLPESLENGTVDLYRAVEFPHRWALERTLLRGVRAVDPTLVEHGGRFWLFVNVAEPGAAIDDELHVYFAPSLAGPWLAHAANPVVSDVRRARPAGRVFRIGGDLVRPSQDCSRGYGRAVVLNRIDVLTPEDYSETPIARIEPTWSAGLIGTHTYNSTERVEAVDGQRFVLRLPRPARRR
jgi:hypothetical protein